VPVKSSLNPSSLGGVSSNTSIVTTQTNIHNLTTCTLHGVSAGTTNVHFHAIFSDGSSGDQDVSVTVS
jgi:hypothetical protein